MKVYKPNTDQRAEFVVLVNGQRGEEYAITQPTPLTLDENTVECIIPVSEGDTLTIRGYFEGSVLNATFDLLADGSFVQDDRVQGPKSEKVKFLKKRVEIEQVFNVPRTVNRSNSSVRKGSHLGTLCVKSIAPRIYDAAGAKLAVGTLAIVVSNNQEAGVNYSHEYTDLCLGGCEDLLRTEEICVPDLTPTFELGITAIDDEPISCRPNKHAQHFTQSDRPGNEHWARFVFYYRERDEVERRCQRLMEQDHPLKPGPSSGFIFAQKKKVHFNSLFGDVSDDDDGELFHMPASKEQDGHTDMFESSEKLFCTPEPDSNSNKHENNSFGSIAIGSDDENDHAMPFSTKCRREKSTDTPHRDQQTIVESDCEDILPGPRRSRANWSQEGSPRFEKSLQREEGFDDPIDESGTRSATPDDLPSPALEEVLDDIPMDGITVEELCELYEHRGMTPASLFSLLDAHVQCLNGIYHFANRRSSSAASLSAKTWREMNAHIQVARQYAAGPGFHDLAIAAMDPRVPLATPDQFLPLTYALRVSDVSCARYTSQPRQRGTSSSAASSILGRERSPIIRDSPAVVARSTKQIDEEPKEASSSRKRPASEELQGHHDRRAKLLADNKATHEQKRSRAGRHGSEHRERTEAEKYGVEELEGLGERLGDDSLNMDLCEERVLEDIDFSD